MSSLTVELTPFFAHTSELWHCGHHCLPQPPSKTQVDSRQFPNLSLWMPRASAQPARHHCSHMPYQECTGPGLSAKGTRILSSRDPDPRSLEEVPGGGPCVRSLGTAVLLSKFLGGLLTVTQATSTEDAAVSRAWAHGCCRSPGGGRGDIQPEGSPGERPADRFPVDRAGEAPRIQNGRAASPSGDQQPDTSHRSSACTEGRGERRDQRPTEAQPRPRGPASPPSTDSPVVAEMCMGVSGWEALPLELEGRTTVLELGKLLYTVGACSFSWLSLYLFNDNKASLLHLAHWPVSVC